MNHIKKVLTYEEIMYYLEKYLGLNLLNCQKEHIKNLLREREVIGVVKPNGKIIFDFDDTHENDE